jgi:hypothetical protein
MLAASVSFVAFFPSARAEMQCAPKGASVQHPTTDKFYSADIASWRGVTKARYLEGESDNACTDVTVSGYESYPTKKCLYQSADAGSGTYPALESQVILLDPSAEQLSSWSIHACRTNGATDAHMAKCLQKLRNFVVGQNSAQFPVAGSVVESYCNSSPNYRNGCGELAPADKGRQPRNTWFRDGIAVDYNKTNAFDVRWDAKAYLSETFVLVFDVDKSDLQIRKTYKYARVAGAIREDWESWRKHIQEPVVPQGVIDKEMNGSGWRSIARKVHRDACKSDTNELFDAVVFANRKSWIGD